MVLSNKAYDILNKIQRWLPALAVFYLALCNVWDLPYGEQVNQTILAVAALLAATLEISTGKYHSNTVVDLLGAFVDDEEEGEEEPEETPAEE